MLGTIHPMQLQELFPQVPLHNDDGFWDEDEENVDVDVDGFDDEGDTSEDSDDGDYGYGAAPKKKKKKKEKKPKRPAEVRPPQTPTHKDKGKVSLRLIGPAIPPLRHPPAVFFNSNPPSSGHEYLIKFKIVSHLHNAWVPEWWLARVSTVKLKNFKLKNGMRSPHLFGSSPPKAFLTQPR